MASKPKTCTEFSFCTFCTSCMYQKQSGRWIIVMLTIHGAKKSIVKNAYAQLSYAHYRILNLT